MKKKSRPMYRCNLRTNLLRELMAFREFPWGDDGADASYASHREVQQYMEDYAEEFNLLEHVPFGCRVDHLRVLTTKCNNDRIGEEEKCCDSWPRIFLEWS